LSEKKPRWVIEEPEEVLRRREVWLKNIIRKG